MNNKAHSKLSNLSTEEVRFLPIIQPTHIHIDGATPANATKPQTDTGTAPLLGSVFSFGQRCYVTVHNPDQVSPAIVKMLRPYMQAVD